MYSKVNYTIVGIFVLLFGVGMVWFALWLAKSGIQEKYDIYKLEMTESVSGLSEDSNVKFRGVNIGRVREIRIDPDNVEQIEVILEIKQGIAIKEDMVANAQMLGVTGLLFIEISGGTNEAKTLESTEDYIPVVPTAPSWFTKTRRGLGTLAERVTLLVDRGQKLLSEKNVETLGKVFDNTEKITARAEEVEQKAINSLDEVDMTLREFRASMDEINKKFAEATADFKQMQKDFTGIKKVTIPMIDKLMETSKNFNRVTLKFEKSLDRGDYNAKKILEPMIVDMGILSEQMTDLTKEFEQSPSDIFFKSRKPRRGPGE